MHTKQIVIGNKYYDIKEEPHFTVFGNSKYPIFRTFAEFIESNVSKALIPILAASRERIKKRTLTQCCTKSEYINIYNKEPLNGYWHDNLVGDIELEKPYLLYIEKNRNAINDFIILRIKPIERMTFEFDREYGGLDDEELIEIYNQINQ